VIRCFAWVPRIKNKGVRRFVMCLVGPIVLLEYIVNAPIGFAYDFKSLWNMDSHV
jgi:hypothetical protein